jgi:hypothetical protein
VDKIVAQNSGAQPKETAEVSQNVSEHGFATSSQPCHSPLAPQSSNTQVEGNVLQLKEQTLNKASVFKAIAGPASKGKEESLWNKIPLLRHLDRNPNIWVSTRPKGNERYVTVWEDHWKKDLEKKLRGLNFDLNDVFSFELCMVGSQSKDKSMKPAILMMCREERRSAIDNELRPIFNEIVPKEEVDLRIVGRPGPAVTTASPSGDLHPETQLGLDVELFWSYTHNETVMGLVGRICADAEERRFFPISTIGGVIIVGETLYMLTTAHSMFKKTEYSESNSLAAFLRWNTYSGPSGAFKPLRAGCEI